MNEDLRALLIERFDWFVYACFAEMEPRTNVEREPYLEAMCFALQQAATTNGSRLLVNLPPRHGKSFASALCLPAWLLGRNPSMDIAVVTYGGDLEREHVDGIRRLMQTDLYRALFPHVQLQSARVNRLSTTEGGGYRPVTIGGAFTGLGTDLLILDDLHKSQEINSAVMREQAINFFRSTAVTRFNDPNASRIITITHRLHVDDFSQMLIDTGTFQHLNLPAIASIDAAIPLYDGEVWTWQAGELLSPARFTRETLVRQRREMEDADFNAQYLQAPDIVGAMIDPSRLTWVPRLPPREQFLAVVLSVDTAIKIGDDCDYSVISAFAFDGENWFMVDLLRDKLELPELQAAVVAANNRWAPKEILIEDSSMGPALKRYLRDQRLPGRLQGVDGDKAERLNMATPMLYSPRLSFPLDQRWSADVRRELVGFPSARHDDIVDTISQFANWHTRFCNEEWIVQEVYNEPYFRERRRSPRDRRNRTAT